VYGGSQELIQTDILLSLVVSAAILALGIASCLDPAHGSVQQYCMAIVQNQYGVCRFLLVVVGAECERTCGFG